MSFDAFLFLDGIPGESSSEAHRGEIEVLSWSWGATNSGSTIGAGGGGAGKVVFQDFHFTKRIDKSSPQILLRCCTGQHIPKATLTVHRASSSAGGSLGPVLFQCDLTQVLVSSFQSSDTPDAPDVPPTDSFSLNFTKIEFRYMPQSDNGVASPPVRACWDLQQRRAC